MTHIKRLLWLVLGVALGIQADVASMVHANDAFMGITPHRLYTALSLLCIAVSAFIKEDDDGFRHR